MLGWALRVILQARSLVAKYKVSRLVGVDIDKFSKVDFNKIKKIRKHSILKISRGAIVEAKINFECDCGRVRIGSNTFVGASHVVCSKDIFIGDNVLISWGCTIVDHDSHAKRFSVREKDVDDWFVDKKNWASIDRKAIHIRDKSWVGFNSIILKGVTIGEGAIVGAGSVVTRDVPPWTIVAGNPARIIREIPVDER